jgi:3-oxoacyl-[acyl-carrier protein] reductase
LSNCHYERSEESAVVCGSNDGWGKQQIPHGLKAVRDDNSKHAADPYVCYNTPRLDFSPTFCEQKSEISRRSALVVIILLASTGGFMAGVEGRVALVTGASQGIGRACALVLAEAGAKVALCARNQEKLEQLAQEIGGKGGEAAVFKMDVIQEEEIKAGVKAAIARFGKIDILVNNAGITRDQLIMRMKRADWDDVINTNLTAPFLLIQAVIGSMLKQRWGRIINVTSIFGQIGQVGQANYSSSKAGLIGLTMAVAREVGSRNITVNAVAPGFIETAMTAALSPELKENIRKNIPLGHGGTDLDVAHAVKFLASEEAGYITGEVLKINGGILMG